MLSIVSRNITYDEKNMTWMDFPEPFERMEFQINPKQSIVMEGFDSYLRTKDMEFGVMNSNFNGVSKVFLFGRALGKTAVVKINCKTGKVDNYIVEQGEEYGGKLQAEGHWKKGVSGISSVKLKEV